MRPAGPSAAWTRLSSAAVLCLSLPLLLNAKEQRFDVGELAGLGEVVERTETESFNGRFRAAVAGHDDGFGVGRDLLERGENLQPGLVVLHAQIEDRGVEHGFLDRLRCRILLSGQTVTSWPSRGSSVRMNSRRWASSSTKRIRSRLCAGVVATHALPIANRGGNVPTTRRVVTVNSRTQRPAMGRPRHAATREAGN